MRAGFIVFTSLSCLMAFAACGGDDEGGGGGGKGGSPGGACVPTAEECYVSGPSGPGAECMAKADNTGQTTWQGRLTSITVTKPAVLSGEFVQVQVIDDGIDLNLPACNENGLGTFSWLFKLDSTTGSLRTGGALPIADAKAGGCLVSLPTGALPVAPIDVQVTIDPDKLGFAANDIDVNVPIFQSATELTNPIILPLHKVDLAARFNDASHNCIGHFNGPELDPINSCLPDTKSEPPQRAWTSGGSLKGHIKIDEADKVFVKQRGATLCVLLAGADWEGPNDDCASSTKWTSGERPEADWCSTTDQAADGTCKDAWRLEGGFAAAAFIVTGDCP